MAKSLKALAIDLDGTLLVGEDLPEGNREAVRAAADSGYHVIIATARWRQLAEKIVADIGLTDVLIIACSGAQVYCTKTKQDIFDTRLPIEFVQELYAICNDNRCIASATVDSQTWLKIDRDPGPDDVSPGLVWVRSLPAPDQIPRIATVQGSATIELVRDLHQRWKDEVQIFNSIGPTGRIIITVTASGADKGTALNAACHHLSIDTDSVVAFGDAENDIMMFREAGVSVAMGQAEAAVKDAATHVTADHREDGVGVFIRGELLRNHPRPE